MNCCYFILVSHAMSGFGLKSYNHYGLRGWACGDEVAGKAESSRRGVSEAVEEALVDR